MITFIKIAAAVTFVVFVAFVIAFCKAAGKEDNND